MAFAGRIIRESWRGIAYRARRYQLKYAASGMMAGLHSLPASLNTPRVRYDHALQVRGHVVSVPSRPVRQVERRHVSLSAMGHRSPFLSAMIPSLGTV